MRIIGGFWVYAGILEYRQHFSPSRHPSIADFAASGLGTLCGALVWRRLYE
jgi:VanZ family protein